MSELPIITTPKEKKQLKENQKMEGKQKKVRFYEVVRRRFVERVMDHADPSVLWYSPKEYAMAREKERSLRCYIRKTERTEGNLNAQGILTLEEATRKRMNGERAKSDVLEAQEKQEIAFLTHNDLETTKFVVDGEQLAKAYKPHSRAALAQARHRAMTHATHIHEILSDPIENLISAVPKRGRAGQSPPSSPRSTRGRSPSLIRRPRKRFPAFVVPRTRTTLGELAVAGVLTTPAA